MCQDCQDLKFLSNITQIEGSLEIIMNMELKTLEGLESLSGLLGALIIEDNDVLVSVESLSGVNVVDGDVRILNNP